MVAKVRRQQQLNSGLDVLAAQGLLVLVPHQLRGLKSDLLEHVSHKRVDDVHAFLADSGVVGDASEHFVDVEREGLVVLSSLTGDLFLSLCFSSGHVYSLGRVVFKGGLFYLLLYWLFGFGLSRFGGGFFGVLAVL